MKRGEETLMPNWVLDAVGELTLASDIKVLTFLARFRLYQHSTFETWQVAGELGLDPRTVQASLRRLSEAGHIVSAAGAHCLRGACAKPAQPLHKSTRARPHAEPRPDEENRTPEVKEGREGMEEHQERVRARAKPGGDEPSLSGEGGEASQSSGGAPGAGAPGGARPGPALVVKDFGQPPGGEGTTDATSFEKVPPGAAGAAALDALLTDDPTRVALQIAFGPPFLARLLSEGPLRPGWLGLSAERVAELHQEALESSGEKPWKTLLISQLDIEVAKGRAGRGNLRLGKRREDLTPEEWLA